MKEVYIGKNVLIADRVFISDNLHGYENVAKPVQEQQSVFKNPVRIGAGSWIGVNAAVIGAEIGKNCVIGANAVVTKDVPDYCVVAGIPARIIRRFNEEKGEWEKA
ncbi:MAG: acyltransferase [Bacteroidetes bacterium]|nr:acyltransferase [Bacteroidota bacterium]